MEYEEQAYATMLDAPLDESRLRGDEPSVLYLELKAHNSAWTPGHAFVWFHVSSQKHFELTNGLLLGTSNPNGTYERRRLRAVFEMEGGSLQLGEMPPESAYSGRAVLWTALVPAQSSAVVHIKIPFRTMISSRDQERVRQSRFMTRLDDTLDYWRKMTSRGMQIQVPDAEFNRFWHANLQHMLVSFYRDLPSGYDMLPAGTFDYNVFPTETCIQVRLLEMRGLNDLVWRFLKPIVELQGTHPFPGAFSRHLGNLPWSAGRRRP